MPPEGNAQPETTTKPRHLHNFIDGEYVKSAGDKIFESRCPADNAVVAIVDEASRADVDRAVSSA
ncbi:hypothetical protein MNBD_ALPHA05-1036, partial [hydrothermal vent metagenome]